MSKKVACYKFTLPSKKVIIIREPKISDTRTASQVAGRKAGTNQVHCNVLLQEEMIKLLLVSINDNKLSSIQKEDLDSLFTMKEYGYVLKCVQQVGGGDEEEGEPQMEIVTTGD